MANSNTNFTVAGLNSNNCIIGSAGLYSVSGKVQLPTETEDGGTGASAVVCTISQNGTPLYSTPAGQMGFGLNVSCSAGDSISVALTSGAAIDQTPNVIKCTVSVA